MRALAVTPAPVDEHGAAVDLVAATKAALGQLPAKFVLRHTPNSVREAADANHGDEAIRVDRIVDQLTRMAAHTGGRIETVTVEGRTFLTATTQTPVITATLVEAFAALDLFARPLRVDTNATPSRASHR